MMERTDSVALRPERDCRGLIMAAERSTMRSTASGWMTPPTSSGASAEAPRFAWQTTPSGARTLAVRRRTGPARLQKQRLLRLCLCLRRPLLADVDAAPPLQLRLQRRLLSARQ